MESNDKLKEMNINNRTCYYFDDKREVDEYINVGEIFQTKNHTKIFQFITFYTKNVCMQNYFASGSIKQIE